MDAALLHTSLMPAICLRHRNVIPRPVYAPLARRRRHSARMSGLTYNERGQLTSVTYSNGAVTSYAYHPTRRGFLWNVATRTSASVSVFNQWYHYDAGGRRIKMDDKLSDIRDWLYVYDPLNRLVKAKNLVTTTDMTNLAADYAYDPENRPIAVTRGTAVTRFEYGPDTQRTRMMA
jgi:YD repeat-containing protein